MGACCWRMDDEAEVMLTAEALLGFKKTEGCSFEGVCVLKVSGMAGGQNTLLMAEEPDDPASFCCCKVSAIRTNARKPISILKGSMSRLSLLVL